MSDTNDPISLQCADIVTDLYGCDKHGPFFEAAHKVANLVEGLEADLKDALELLAQVNENYTPNGSWFFDRDALLARHNKA